MANAATKDTVAADLKKTDWKKALRVLIDSVKAKKDKVSSINGEISAKYEILEKEGVNKKGAKIFLSLDNLEASERRDVLRTLEALGEAAGWDGSADLVDKAEDKSEPGANVLEMPKRGSKAPKDAPPVDEVTKLDPAAFKSAIVEHIAAESDLKEADAYVLANRIYDDLTSEEKGKMTHELAVSKAEAEMDGWPEEGETEQ